MNITTLSTDIFMTLDGDLYLDAETGSDLYISGPRKNELLESICSRRILSTKGEWDFAPSCGTDLIDFVGQPNTEETSVLIKSAIMMSLTEDNLIRSSDLGVDGSPSGPNSMFFLLAFKGIEPTDPVVTLGWGYDLRDSKMVPRIINL
ncbi:MAG: hypothetical protein CMF69_00280 [Magnetovibrio sp.]|nr:hypothetical protein [Magnetovibrio sp.]